MKIHDRRLSLGALVRVFWRRVSATMGLTILETAMLAALPLLIGRSIDGLLNDNPTPFLWLLGAMSALLVVAIARRLYDTRTYGGMRVEFGDAIVQRAKGEPVSTVNARLNMGRELVDFLENEAPVVLTAIIHLIASLAVLFSFHGYLAISAGGAALATVLVYGLSSGRFFNLNRRLNRQVEKQVATIESGAAGAVRAHLSALRRCEVRLSDTEALVYGLIFALLLAMLSFNLWFAAARLSASPGEIFSIVTYSYEFIESAVVLPAALQSLTRISEITQRINVSAPAQ